jgi:hypothetical protein
MEATIISLTYDKLNKENGLNDLAALIDRIEEQVSDRSGLKIIISSERKDEERLHHHILINREINSDIEKEWKYGQTALKYIETPDQYKKTIWYMTI